MKFVTYLDNGKEVAGIMAKDLQSVISFQDAGMPYETMLCFIAKHTDGDMAKLKEMEKGSGKALSSVKLIAPIPHPHHDVICLGLNYMDHVEESKGHGSTEADKPRVEAIYFGKRCINAVGPDGEINSHSDVLEQCDYEAELGVVIGKNCDHVKREDAWGKVFGIVTFNDVSGRELQFKHQQWFFGKSLDDYTAMGPWIVSTDEFAYPLDLQVQARVNGEVRQNNRTSNMIFPPDYVISELSQAMTLDPGTIIATGTPSGVGVASKPHRCMKPGDVCEIEIEGCGILRNVIK